VCVYETKEAQMPAAWWIRVRDEGNELSSSLPASRKIVWRKCAGSASTRCNGGRAWKHRLPIAQKKTRRGQGRALRLRWVFVVGLLCMCMCIHQPRVALLNSKKPCGSRQAKPPHPCLRKAATGTNTPLLLSARFPPS